MHMVRKRDSEHPMNDDERALRLISDPRYHARVEVTMQYDWEDGRLQSEEQLQHLITQLYNEPDARVYFFQEVGKPNRLLTAATERGEIRSTGWEGGFYRDPHGHGVFVRVPPPVDGKYEYAWQEKAVASSPMYLRLPLALTRRKERELEARQLAEVLARVPNEREAAAVKGEDPSATRADIAAYEFVDKGGVWSITFEGVNKWFPRRLKGFQYLYMLLQNPDTRVSVFEMQSMGVGVENLVKVAAAQAGKNWNWEKGKSPIREYYELKRQVEAAIREGDSVQERVSQDELERWKKILGVLTSRASEKSVSIANSVRDAIKRAIASIEEQLPSCAKHLTSWIQTGTTCRYTSRSDVTWRFE